MPVMIMFLSKGPFLDFRIPEKDMKTPNSGAVKPTQRHVMHIEWIV